MTAKIPVTPKLYTQSKTSIGIVISVAGVVLSTLGQQPWLDPNVAKIVTTGGLVLAGIGQVDRKDLFFRPSVLKEAAQAATKELTISEGIDTIKQGIDALTAAPDQRVDKWVELVMDTQKRLTAQDQVLAEIKSVVTAHQVPLLADYPDRTDLPSDPRLRAQREAPQMAAPPIPGFEPDVLQANSEGVLEIVEEGY